MGRTKGYKLSDETKRKIGLANKGRSSPRKGKHLPEKHRNNIRKSLQSKDYKVVRLWEHEIHEDIMNCFDRLHTYLKI